VRCFIEKVNMRTRILVFFALLLVVPAALTQTWGNDLKAEARIDALLKQMTLEEKLGQMNQYSVDDPTGPGKKHGAFVELAQQGKVGSLFNLVGPRVNELQRVAMEQSRLKIPILFGLDVIHGYRTIFPTPLALSATWDPALIEKTARVAAIEASAAGLRWTFSPMVDIARDARWGRIVEGAGEDPYLGSMIAQAYVRGYQGTPGDPTSIAACAKHFVGYGAAEGGRDYNTTEIPERLLRQVYLPPFLAAKDAGALTFMSAFNSLDEVPASANSFTLDQVLRKEWKFRGTVVSDWTSIEEEIQHGIALDGATAARKSLAAGVDMDMESSLYLTTLAEQVKSGKVPMAQIDEAVRRILRVKFALGLFGHPYADVGSAAKVTLTLESLALAREAAEKSFVLLKNEGVLPLKEGAKVALVGPLADSARDMIGTWSAKGEASDVVTLRSALAEKLGAGMTFVKGTEVLSDSENGFAEALQAAQQADVVLAAMGEDAQWMTGEAASRSELTLPGNQEKLLEALVSTGKPVVLIVFSGRPLMLNWSAQHVAAILEAWHPGVQAGPALVLTLYGDSNPSGKLTTSFPRSVGQEPLYYNHLNTGRPADKVDTTRFPTNKDKDKYFSRYVDQQNTALFPFGFGLSYTKFSYTPVTLSTTSATAVDLNAGRGAIKATAEVRNAGDRDGEEVVQLYIREQGTSVSRPVRELKAFQRVALKAGESKKVEFTIGGDDLRFWNIDMKNVVEPAKVSVWIAGSSADGTPVEFAIQ